MRFFSRFPYTNFNNVNLDWFIEKLNEVVGIAEGESARIDAAEADASAALTAAGNAQTAATNATTAANAANSTANNANIAAAAAAISARDANAGLLKNVYIGTGTDLLSVFDNLAALHAAVAAGDFSKINIGDYFTQDIVGSFKDFADDSVKSVNATMKFTVAGINHYNGTTTVINQNHLVLFSSLIANSVKYNGTRGVYYDTTKSSSWSGSALYQTLNDETDGFVALLGDMGQYLFSDLSMRLPKQESGAPTVSDVVTVNMGKLHPPTLRELTGIDIVTNPVWFNSVPQLPLFYGGTYELPRFYSGSGGNMWLIGKITNQYNLIQSSAAKILDRYENNSAYAAFLCIFI